MAFSTKEVVKALYRGVLNRDPDPASLTAFIARVTRDEMSIMELAEAFYSSEEHRQLMSKPNGIADNSQHGELVKMLSLIMRSVPGPSIIVDVGARGRERSNSYDLMSTFGWRGLLVEANPALYGQIRREFDGLDYELVESAVGPEPGLLPFYLGINDDVSSLNPDAAKGWGDIQGVVEVNVRRLPEILLEKQIPFNFDVLSIDIESVDIPVLNDLIATSAYRPQTILIEVVHEGVNTSLASVGANEEVQAFYEVVDCTLSNLFLSKR